MLPITKDLTEHNHYKGRSQSIKYLVIHWVGEVSTAKNNATYFKSKRSASAHYFVDDKSIYQVVEEFNTAWHCGTTGITYSECRNASSIGIEMCLDKANHISDKTIANTAELVQHLMQKYNIKESNVIRHYDVTRKQCPAPYIDSAKWKTLKDTLVGNRAVISPPVTSDGYKVMTVNVKSNLNVRKTYSTNSAIIGKLAPNQKVAVQKIGVIWARITYKNGVGYVHKKYLK